MEITLMASCSLFELSFFRTQNILFQAESYHGKGGYLSVEDRAWQSNLPNAFVNAGHELGYDRVDVNGAEQIGNSLDFSTGWYIKQLLFSRFYDSASDSSTGW